MFCYSRKSPLTLLDFFVVIFSVSWPLLFSTSHTPNRKWISASEYSRTNAVIHANPSRIDGGIKIAPLARRFHFLQCKFAQWCHWFGIFSGLCKASLANSIRRDPIRFSFSASTPHTQRHFHCSLGIFAWHFVRRFMIFQQFSANFQYCAINLQLGLRKSAVAGEDLLYLLLEL